MREKCIKNYVKNEGQGIKRKKKKRIIAKNNTKFKEETPENNLQKNTGKKKA